MPPSSEQTVLAALEAVASRASGRWAAPELRAVASGFRYTPLAALGRLPAAALTRRLGAARAELAHLLHRQLSLAVRARLGSPDAVRALVARRLAEAGCPPELVEDAAGQFEATDGVEAVALHEEDLADRLNGSVELAQLVALALADERAAAIAGDAAPAAAKPLPVATPEPEAVPVQAPVKQQQPKPAARPVAAEPKPEPVVKAAEPKPAPKAEPAKQQRGGGSRVNALAAALLAGGAQNQAPAKPKARPQPKPLASRSPPPAKEQPKPQAAAAKPKANGGGLAAALLASQGGAAPAAKPAPVQKKPQPKPQAAAAKPAPKQQQQQQPPRRVSALAAALLGLPTTAAAPAPKEEPVMEEPVMEEPAVEEPVKPEPVKATPKPEPVKAAPKPEPVKAAPKPEPVKATPKPEPVKAKAAPSTGVKDAFTKVRRRKLRYVTFEMSADGQKVVVAEEGARNSTYQDLVDDLPSFRPAFAIYDHEFKKDGRLTSRMEFLYWSCRNANQRSRVLYSQALPAFRAQFDGCRYHSVTDHDQVEELLEDEHVA